MRIDARTGKPIPMTWRRFRGNVRTHVTSAHERRIPWSDVVELTWADFRELIGA